MAWLRRRLLGAVHMLRLAPRTRAGIKEAPMKLTVFGSTGRTGGHVLAEGLHRGHEITAFARRADALQSTSTLAAVVEGDARDPHAVRDV
jgi:hypothetical protein